MHQSFILWIYDFSKVFTMSIALDNVSSIILMSYMFQICFVKNVCVWKLLIVLNSIMIQHFRIYFLSLSESERESQESLWWNISCHCLRPQQMNFQAQFQETTKKNIFISRQLHVQWMSLVKVNIKRRKKI